jgi:3-methyl-2-oxobutanoate hydroxymethyltransferase
MRQKKLTLLEMHKKKEKKEKIAWITAYDLPFAQVAENAGVDMILVGDSGGMVQLGYETTNPVTMDEMILLASSARRGAPNTFIVSDMPQGSYEISCESAVANAMRFIKESGSDSIKLEGGARVADKVSAIHKAGILVMGHLGLTPQSTSSFSGYRVQGKTKDSFEQILKDALALQDAGVFALLLEAMPTQSAQQIARQLDIPVYGIGAGYGVDGQLVIMHDLMGFFQPFRPWFAKCYVPEAVSEFQSYLSTLSDVRETGRQTRSDGLLKLAEIAVGKYVQDVKNNMFPGDEYSYPIEEVQLTDVRSSDLWRRDME